MNSLARIVDAIRDQVISASGPSPDALSVQAVTGDSRKVVPGSVFVAVEGFQTDGHRYIPQALERGAAALVVQRVEPSWAASGIPVIQVADSRRALALLSAAFFGHPGRALTMVGVTGTNGKTTTTILTEGILREAGRNPGLIGTMYARVGGVQRDASNTTPESVDLQALLAEMREVGHDSAVMEVSSHGLVLDRVLGCAFDVAVFTNLTQDHLDFHETMEAYFKAKQRLFTELDPASPGASTPCAVINADDPWGRRLQASTSARVLTYGVEADADLRATGIEHRPEGVSFHLQTPFGEADVILGLSGLFNVYNALAALGAALALEVPLPTALAALQAARPVRGRFETVRAGQDFHVIVDYAHTPDGLQNILQGARALTTSRVLLVFGCGGDRDRKKRPIMGSLAARLADRTFVTSDNPRSEEPAAILRDIVAGWPAEGPRPEVVEDRREAIRRALGEARAQDVVVIAGKGHETYQILADRTIHFDDVEVAREFLEEAHRWKA